MGTINNPPKQEFGVLRECAACGITINRVPCGMPTGDWGQGPEVPLCRRCGSGVLPSMEDLWTAIRVRVHSGAYQIPTLKKYELPQ